MSNERGLSAQELPENQDPGVQFTYDEASGKRIPWKRAEPAEAPKPRRGRPPKAQADEEVPDGGDDSGSAEGAGE